MFGFSKNKCPNCQMGKIFYNNTHIQICEACHKKGYDYEVFKLKTGEVFLIVYLKQTNA
jgi:uncharacterized protein (DUF983 family)